jgi:hypothetical protein
MKFLVDAQLPRHLAASLKPGRSGMLFMPDINMRKMSDNEKMSPKAPTVGAQP